MVVYAVDINHTRWLGGGYDVGVVINPAVHCWVSTWMGDYLWVGKPFLHVTSYLGELSLLSLRGR